MELPAECARVCQVAWLEIWGVLERDSKEI